MDEPLKRKRSDIDEEDPRVTKKARTDSASWWPLQFAWGIFSHAVTSVWDIFFPTGEDTESESAMDEEKPVASMMEVDQPSLPDTQENPVTPKKALSRLMTPKRKKGEAPAILLTNWIKQGKRDYLNYAAFIASRDLIPKHHDDDLIELNPIPRLALEPRLREFVIKKQQELRKQSQDFERKEKLLFEALKKTVEENATFKPVPLTTQQEAEVKRLLTGPNSQVLIDKYNIEIRREDLKRLNPGQWLNDELINFYLQLLSEKSKKNTVSPCHFFNSHFYSLLTAQDTGFFYNRVAKWTKSVDIFSLAKVIFPVHVGDNHWCLGVINIKLKRFEYYDSLGLTNPRCIQNLKKYINEEHTAKKGSPIDLSTWGEHNIGSKNPQQKNYYDCGVFMLKFAEFVSNDQRLTFSQDHMPFFRKQLVLQICNGKLEIN